MCAAPDQLDYFATLALQQRSYQSTSGEGSRINSYCSRIGPRSHWPSPRKRLPSPPIMIHAFPKIFVRLAKFPQTIVIILFVTALTSPYATSAVVTANGFSSLSYGQPFVVKGMNYSPVPIGTAPGNPPYGDYFVPTYANVWKPDIDKIREAGHQRHQIICR